jgi:hypothetical protein
VTEKQLQQLRESKRIDRDTYERASWGDSEALAECAKVLREQAHREWVESVTP